MEFDVDTVLLSVGLIPENELTRSAGNQWIQPQVDQLYMKTWKLQQKKSRK